MFTRSASTKFVLKFVVCKAQYILIVISEMNFSIYFAFIESNSSKDNHKAMKLNIIYD